jgi:hypothetical protein
LWLLDQIYRQSWNYIDCKILEISANTYNYKSFRQTDDKAITFKLIS